MTKSIKPTSPKTEPAMDEYIPRPISRHEYDMVCDATQHFTETYEHYCDRIHAQERAEYLYLKAFPDKNELVSAVERGLDGNATSPCSGPSVKSGHAGCSHTTANWALWT